MKKVTFIILFIFISFFSMAQKQTAIGFKTVSTFAINKYVDQGNLIAGNYPQRTGPLVYWFYAERQLINNLFVEMAIMKKDYLIGYKINPNIEKISWANYSISSFQIPILLKYKFKLRKSVFLSPNIGIVFCTNQNYKSYSKSKNSASNYIIIEGLKTDFVKGFMLGHLGFDMELNLTKNFSFVINTGILKGITTVTEKRISYLLKDSSDWKTAKATNNGDYWYIGLSIKYNFLL